MDILAGVFERTNPSRPLTVTDSLSIDDVVYFLLLTVLNPVKTWSFSFVLYKWTSNTIFLKVSFIVLVGWAINEWNIRRKISLGKAYKFRKGVKNVLITGGVQGLGLEIVNALLKERDTEGSLLYGCKMFIVDILELPQSLKDKGIEHIRCDLSDDDDVEFLLTRLEGIVSDKIDVFISNAAIVHDADTLQVLKEDKISEVWKINFWSFLKLTRFVLKLKNGSHKDINTSRTHIVSIASVLGFVSPSKLSMYSATKASQIAVMDCISHEIGNDGLITSCICPGQLTSPMFENVHVPQKFLAPLVDHYRLAHKVVDIIKEGEQGLFLFPFYANFIPLLKSLPFGIYELFRDYSKMDEQYH